MAAISPIQSFLQWEQKVPDEILFRQPFGGKWKTWTWAEAGIEIRKIAAGLTALNLPPKSNIALLSKNCAHWIICDLAIMMSGHLSIPIYPTLTAHSIKPILDHSGARAIIIGKLDDYSSQKQALSDEIIKISIELYGLKETHTVESFLKNNDPVPECYSWQPDEVFTIIYTSGTTGASKGVMHCSVTLHPLISTVADYAGLPTRPVLFSYLPLSHIAERLAAEMYCVYFGGRISFAESIETFPANLMDTQPNLFFAVPRIWGKLREGILKKVPQRKLTLLLSIPIISTILKKSIRKKLGLANASHIYSSAAPLALDIILWFKKLGILINQAYGMSEDSISHFESPTDYCHGSVGKALPGLKTKFGADGELLVLSHGNMKGYYKEPALTAQTFDEENYLRTGDIGEYNPDGFLFITGRVKDQFKTDKGKYISPAPIEMKLLACADVEMPCVVGTGIPQPIGLITLSESGKSKNRTELEKELELLLQQTNQELDVFERLEKLVIMKENWTLENRLITPSLKVKRNEVEKIHTSNYPQWFAEKRKIIWEN